MSGNGNTMGGSGNMGSGLGRMNPGGNLGLGADGNWSAANVFRRTGEQDMFTGFDGRRTAAPQDSTYQTAPTPTQLLPGQTYPGVGNRYGPDQHQPGRGTPNTTTQSPPWTGMGNVPWSMGPQTYGPDQHQPNRGTPNTNPIPPGFQPPGAGVPWSMGGGLQTYGPDQHQPGRGTPNTTTQAPPWNGMGNVPWSMNGGAMSNPFSVSAPQAAPQQAPGQPQMIPGTNRPMPPGAYIDEYGVPRRAPETPMNPGAGQFGQYTPGPNGFTLDQSGGMNRINGTLFSAEGLNQGGIAAPNYVDYLNRMFRR